MKVFKLVLIRGLPGSGKSTKAKETYPKHTLFEADQFFIQNGQYIYDPLKIKDAHAWCLQLTKTLLLSGHNVVVANTFTQLWELQPYLDLMPREDIEIVTTTGEWPSIHGVLPEVIERMKKRWEIVE